MFEKELTKCLICGNNSNEEFDLGDYFLSMSLLEIDSNVSLREYPKYNYNLKFCKSCNYFWLKNLHPSLKNIDGPIKYHDLRFISNEPESHFNDLLNWFLNLGILEDVNDIGLVSYKDKSLLEKIGIRNISSSLIWKNSDLLSISRTLINKNKSNKLINIKRFDLILARHVLEHLSDPGNLIETLKSMLKKNGIIYFEIPSPVYMINRGFSYYLWEEHTSYFSVESLRRIFEKYKFNSYFTTFDNGFEPIVSVIVTEKILKNKEYEDFKFSDVNLSIEKFKKKHLENKNKIRNFLKKENIKNLYFLGAGHLGIKLISFYDIADFIVGIVDDMPNKQDKVSISTGLKIYSSNNLSRSSTLLHSLPPESVIRVKRNPNYSSHKLISINDII